MAIADAVTLSVTYFAILLGLGVFLVNFLKKRRIPESLFLLLLGLMFSPTIFSNPAVSSVVNLKLVDVTQMGIIPDFLRTLALIMVVFIGMYNLNFRVFKSVSNISIKLAIIGVFFNAVILGLVAHFLFGLNMVYSLLLGAVLSGTEAGVIFAFEKNLNRSKKVLNILKVESIINSPFNVLLPLIFLELIYLHPGALIEPMKYASQLWLMLSVGVGTGIIMGLIAAFMFKGMLKEYSPLLLFSLALITYALATSVGGEGMLAVALCGLFAGNFSLRKMEGVQEFSDHLSQMLTISVFTLFGAQVALFMSFQDILMVLIFFSFIFVSRAFFVLPLLGSLRKKISRKEVLMMCFIAPRGLSAAAMIPIVAGAVVATGSATDATRMINIVFISILLSILVSTAVASLAGMKRFQGEKARDAEDSPEKEVEESGEKSPEPEKEEKTGKEVSLTTPGNQENPMG